MDDILSYFLDQLLQILPVFYGTEEENPYFHLQKYENICHKIFDGNHRLLLLYFPYSLRDEAYFWFTTMPIDSFTWISFQAEFLKTYLLKARNQVLKQRAAFFLFINYMDVHGPYAVLPRPDVIGYEAPTTDRALFELRHQVLPGGPPNPSIQKRAIDAYDTALANLDEGLGRFVESVKSLRLYDDTLIVITSDHGDYLGEHRLAGHPRDVYQPTIHVPLIVKGPRQRKGTVVSRPIMLHQLPHLILSSIETKEGQAAQNRFPPRAMFLAEQYWERGDDMLANPKWGHRFDRVRRAWFEWPYKLIHSSDGKHELYHVVHDPSESNDLIERKPAISKRMTDALRRSLGEELVPAEDDQRTLDFSEHEIEQLKSLGYIE